MEGGLADLMPVDVDNKQQTVKMSDLFSTALLDEHLRNGVVRQQKHPTLNLYIYAYTEQAVHEGIWDECTNECRGLIVDGAGNVVARPFRKFHNLNTASVPETLEANLPSSLPIVTKKLDGSLGIFWRYGGQCGIATRGSFQSEQAQWATAWHAKYALSYARWPDGWTPLFEIIYPQNRIVCQYDFEGLVLLTMVNKRTGEEVDYKRLSYLSPFRFVERFDKSLAECAAENIPNEEGYVLTWPREGKPPLKVKVKFADYVRLHRIVTGLNPKNIWEMLAMGQSLEPLLTPDMPAHFRGWLEDWQKKLQGEHDAIEDEAKYIFDTAQAVMRQKHNLLTYSEPKEIRKDYALFFQAQSARLSAVLFAMLDGKNYHEYIWKLIKPKGNDATFRKDGE
jgi:RNA ligase